MSATENPAPIIKIGKFKTFGEHGPYYEIMGSGYQADGGEWMVPIRVVKTGEELDYRYSRSSLDPDAV